VHSSPGLGLGIFYFFLSDWFLEVLSSDYLMLFGHCKQFAVVRYELTSGDWDGVSWCESFHLAAVVTVVPSRDSGAGFGLGLIRLYLVIEIDFVFTVTWAMQGDLGFELVRIVSVFCSVLGHLS